MADGMREKTTNVGGVIKRIWYAMTGATQGAQLLSLDDAGNLEGKLLNPIINGTATGTAITTTGEASKIMKLGTNGEAKAQAFQVTAMNTPPASPTATGTTGEVRVTTQGLYIANGTNSWIGGLGNYFRTVILNNGNGNGIFSSLISTTPQFGKLIAYNTTDATKFCVYNLYKANSTAIVQYSLVMNNVLAISATNASGTIALNDTSTNIKMSATIEMIAG